jgi:hypothetical protein
MAESESERQSDQASPDEDSGELMYVRCSLCGEWMDVKPGRLNWVSHGLCPTCHDKEMARIRIFLEERGRAIRPEAP